MDWKPILFVVLYVLFAPVIGGFLDGVDRKISARMQGRKGPSVFQAYYDVIKLFQKEPLVVKRSQTFLVMTYLIFMVITGALFLQDWICCYAFLR